MYKDDSNLAAYEENSRTEDAPRYSVRIREVEILGFDLNRLFYFVNHLALFVRNLDFFPFCQNLIVFVLLFQGTRKNLKNAF